MFLDNKYRKYYFKIIENAELQNRKRKQGIYYESHHIIPRCMGGFSQVLLTAKEHFICHLLLCKMLTGNNKHKMINALIRLSFSKTKGQERYTARSYSVVRSFIAQKNKETKTGVKFSIEHKKKIGISLLGKNKGKKKPIRSEDHKKNNGLSQKGKILSEIAIEKRSMHRIGKTWITNGSVDRFCDPNNIPEGFYLGRCNFKITKERKDKGKTRKKKG